MFEMRAKMITVGLLGTSILLPLDLAEASQVGPASWYALKSRTASGEMMNPSALTAAHRSLPFGTEVLVENLNNGRTVVVRINDRGPFTGGRIIDLSKAAAAQIGMIDSGVAKVRVTGAGGGSLGALGRTTSQAAKAQSAKPKVAKAAPSKGKAKKAAKKPSSKRRHVSKSRGSSRVAAATSKRTAAQRTARRSVTKTAAHNPYAILGGTPGFMKPASRRAG